MSSGSKEGKSGKLKLTKPENGQAVGKKERKEGETVISTSVWQEMVNK